MRKLLILSTALTTVGFAASAEQVTVMSWGGAYGVSQVEAYNKPLLLLRVFLQQWWILTIQQRQSKQWSRLATSQ